MKTKSEKINPFPGLRPYNPEDIDFYYGRETESEEIAHKLISNRFVAIIGASAAGKSSLINCGLLPKIRSLASNSSLGWKVIYLRPGNDPVGNLTEALITSRPAGVAEAELRDKVAETLKEDPDGLTKVLEGSVFKTSERILLVIDQFEELFRYRSLENVNGREGDTGQFLNLITGAAESINLNLFTVIAIRSDLISECAQNKKLNRLVNSSNYFIPAMTRENLQKVIEEPVLKAGAKIDPILVDSLVNDVYERSDCLPVLQHALMRMWSQWMELDEPGKPLNFTEYESVGTVSHSISRHGNALYEEFSPGTKQICEKLFKMITGKGSDNKGVRRPMQLKNIRLALDCPESDLIEVIEKFRTGGVSFLNPSARVALGPESIIDLTHESLMHLWDRLQKWIDEEAVSVQMYLRLSEAAELYQMGKKTLLRQPDLQMALDWRDKNKPGLPWAQKYNPAFERVMVYLRTSEKEFIESEERKARQNKWRLKKIKIISSILGSLVLIVSLAMAGIFISKISAERRFKESERQRREVAAQKTMADQFATLAIRKSIESDSIALAAAQKEEQERTLKESAQKEILTVKKEAGFAIQNTLKAELTAKEALEQRNEAKRLRMISVARSMSLKSLQMSDQKDLQALLAYQAYLFNKKYNGNSNDGDIYQGLYNLAKTNKSSNYQSFNGNEGHVKDVAFVPGKKEFYTSGSDGKILKWNLSNKEQSYKVIYDSSEIFGVLELSPDAGWLACGGENSDIRMLPLNGHGNQYKLKGHTDKIKSLVFSYDGKYLYSGSLDGKVLKWDLSARTSTDMTTGSMKIISIDLSSNNKYIAGVTPDGKALVWNPKESTESFRIEKSGSTIRTIRFKPDEERIALGYDDGNVEIWDIPSRKLVSEFKAHSGDVSGIRFNKKLKQVGTSGSDGSLKIWDSGDFTAIPVSLTDNGGLVLTFEFSPDGEVIVSGDISEKNNLVVRPAYADAFAADGCLYITRNFTPDEWLAYVGKDIGYEDTCPDRGHKIKIREIR